MCPPVICIFIAVTSLLQYWRQSLASRGPREFEGHITSNTLGKTLATALPGGNFSSGGPGPLATRWRRRCECCVITPNVTVRGFSVCCHVTVWGR